MAEFILHIRTLLGVLGHKTLEPIAQPVVTATQSSDQASFETGDIASTQAVDVELSIKSVKASGVLTNEGLVVLEGSSVSSDVKNSLSVGYRSLRDKLIEDNIISEVGGTLKFAKKHIFSSPSQAAAVMVGYAINGRHYWKLSDGRTIREYEEAESINQQ